MEHNPNILHPYDESAAPADPSAAIPLSDTTDPAPLVPFDPVTVAARRDGWAPERQRAFIEALADCGIVREAAARVGMSVQSACKLRRRADAAGFSRAWDKAVRVGAEQLRSLAWERAVNGTARSRYFGGKVVGEERIFDNRLLIYLLGRSAVNGPTGGDLDGKVAGWEAMMGALEDQLPTPLPGPGEAHGAPVWCNASGWLTSFPPPDGFDGQEWGEWGGQSWCRTLTEAEEAKLSAWSEGRLDAADRQRDRYFDRLAANAEVEPFFTPR